MLGDQRSLGGVFTLHLGVSLVLIDWKDEKAEGETLGAWLKTISILNVRFPRLVG